MNIITKDNKEIGLWDLDELETKLEDMLNELRKEPTVIDTDIFLTF